MTAPPVQPNSGYPAAARRSRQSATAREPCGDRSAAAAGQRGRRGDAFDPNQNPNAPGVPRALGWRSGAGRRWRAGWCARRPWRRRAARSVECRRRARSLWRTGANAQRGAPPPGNTTAALTTLPPSQTPRDEFDLGIGYIQRKDYALAEETMRNFAQKYPSDALVPDAQYWLGESLFQRQKYRDAAEAFLGVTTKFDNSAKAPDALLRLGQSLAALKEKEAACAAFGEVTRKYPRASNGVKQGVGREQKRVGC